MAAWTEAREARTSRARASHAAIVARAGLAVCWAEDLSGTGCVGLAGVRRANRLDSNRRGGVWVKRWEKRVWLRCVLAGRGRCRFAARVNL